MYRDIPFFINTGIVYIEDSYTESDKKRVFVGLKRYYEGVGFEDLSGILVPDYGEASERLMVLDTENKIVSKAIKIHNRG